MSGPSAAEPDDTAVRTALWRTLHLEADVPPHMFEDVGPKPAAPERGPGELTGSPGIGRIRRAGAATHRPYRASAVSEVSA